MFLKIVFFLFGAKILCSGTVDTGFLTIVFAVFVQIVVSEKNYVKSIELHPHLILQRIYAHAFNYMR